jgi:hypothetical protein
MNTFIRIISRILVLCTRLSYILCDFVVNPWWKRVCITPADADRENIAFCVTCIGNGHINQAINLERLIRRFGNGKLKVVFMVEHYRDKVKYYTTMLEKAGVSVVFVPGIVMDYEKTGARPDGGIFGAIITHLRLFVNIDPFLRELKQHRVGTIVNFYDGLTPMVLCSRLATGEVKGIRCLAIANMFNHFLPYVRIHSHRPIIPIQNQMFEEAIHLVINRYMMQAADMVLCISSIERPCGLIRDINDDKLILVSPLVTPLVTLCEPIERQHHKVIILTYLHTVPMIQKLHREFSELCTDQLLNTLGNRIIEVHVFTGGKSPLELAGRVADLPLYFYFHSVDRKEYHRYFEVADGVISGSGNESCCEIAYYSKPALVIPIENHLEQTHNANLFASTFSGIFNSSVAEFMTYVLDPKLHRIYQEETESYRRYCDDDSIYREMLA